MEKTNLRNPFSVLAIALLLSCFTISSFAQNADSIRVEQAGDFVKIFYKITGSTPNQTFRISLLASINGGLRSELRSVSGDIGENIVGGKSEYWILWDVLKDIEELNSVEFFVKSELMRDLSESETRKSQNVSIKYQKRIFNIMPMISMPGPRVGGLFGVNGAVGFLAGIAVGEAAEPEAFPIMVGGSAEMYDRGGGIQMTVNITVRLVSQNLFQLHAAGGFSAAQMDYYEYDNTNLVFHTVMTNGLSAGLLFGTGRMSAALMFMKYDPGSVEKSNDNFFLMTPMNLFSAGIGVRF